ncbi:MAG: hydrogenase [Candidatus Altiarchaeales archaeon ex4484_96]|nr:MAG: hydrogenase [Candidatus Altiarchaeales archaeon ex4484_96]
MNLVLATGFGFWNPIVFILTLMLLMIVSYLIWRQGEENQGEGIQGNAFFSGDLLMDKGVQAQNLYWGFTSALREYYDWMIKQHTGIINDYVAWFIALTAALLLLVVAL